MSHSDISEEDLEDQDEIRDTIEDNDVMLTRESDITTTIDEKMKEMKLEHIIRNSIVNFQRPSLGGGGLKIG
jgi:CHASE3 domain sensor protein